MWNMHISVSAKIQRGQQGISGSKMTNLTINGKKMKARRGETVLQVARRAGIKIPTLCHHNDLTPYGGCRLCIVEIKGREIPLTACTLIPEDGMVITTDTPRLRKLRRFTMQLILSEHPNACLVCERETDCANFQECIKKSAVTFGCKSCPRNDNCELQDLVRELGIKDIPFDFRYRNLDVQRNDPFFDRDYNLCILCGRCIRVCQEIRQAHTLEFHHRGPDTLVGTAFDLPHLQSGCQFCGACVDFCPTGALRDRFSRYDKPAEKAVRTTCLLCSIGCQIDLNVSKDKITCTVPHKDQICVRGRFAVAPLVNHPKRGTRPLLKKGNSVIEVDWDEALSHVAKKLNEHKDHTGILLTPQLTNESIAKIYSLADSLRAKIAVPMYSDVIPVPLKITKITGNAAFVIVNTDMIADYSILLLKLRKKFIHKAAFIVIDAVAKIPNRFADAVLKPAPGTENEVLQALISTKNPGRKTGLTSSQIETARHLLKGSKVFVLYDPQNTSSLQIKKPAMALPLSGHGNILKIASMGFDGTHDQILADKHIDCLYVIGAAPKIRKKYQTTIIQDCFLPDFDFDVFLPAATFAEINGSVYDIEGKLRKLRRGIAPVDQAMPDEDVIDSLSRTMDIKLRKKAQQRKPKKAKRSASGSTTKGRRIMLIARQNAYVYRNKPLSSVLKGFERLREDRYIWLNERTAAKYKLKENMEARLTGRQIDLVAPVKTSASIPDNTAFIYYNPATGHISNGPVRLQCTRS
jgi:NADH dehydrogenase/NADH:ubiquinone oxidoreductase subunit G